MFPYIPTVCAITLLSRLVKPIVTEAIGLPAMHLYLHPSQTGLFDQRLVIYCNELFIISQFCYLEIKKSPICYSCCYAE